VIYTVVALATNAFLHKKRYARYTPNGLPLSIVGGHARLINAPPSRFLISRTTNSFLSLADIGIDRIYQSAYYSIIHNKKVFIIKKYL